MLFLLIFALLGVALVAGSGDIVTGQAAHERADEASLLGALAGGAIADVSALYAGNPPALDAAAALSRCDASVRITAPDARRDPLPCAIVDGRMVVTVVIDVSLPIPVPFLGSRVSARHVGRPVAGTTAPA